MGVTEKTVSCTIPNVVINIPPIKNLIAKIVVLVFRNSFDKNNSGDLTNFNRINEIEIKCRIAIGIT